jgi:hypothetical protein
MKNGFYPSVFVRTLFGSLAAILFFRPFAQADPVYQADALVESIGVNVQVWTGRGVGNGPVLHDKMVAAGVRHARDWLAIDKPDAIPAWNAMTASGIHMCFTLTPGWGGIPAMRQFLITNGLVAGTALIEGPNEPNNGSGSWATSTVSFCTQLFAAFRSNPPTASLPILAPALAIRASDMSPDHAALGDLSALVDYGNAHPYPGGGLPLYNLVKELPLEKVNVGTKPMVVTETGYHNALSTANGHNPASETATALYLPRLYLEYLSQGVFRTYWFSLLDNYTDAGAAAKGLSDIEAHFGLVRYDFSEKPAYLALKNLITIMQDPGVTFAPSPFAFTVTGSSDVTNMLFQKRNGDYYLAVWRQVSVWNAGSRVDIVPASTNITVSFTNTPENASIFYPTTSPDAAGLYNNVTAVQIPLQGQVAIVKLSNIGSGIQAPTIQPKKSS